ncbi:hypothetical protein EJ05DRAFT_534032 [Pseudovirgaria hyperparasitica]|uniref:Uncharacterized protein n=1 Tax=Pseudovirgaria hyperparasitica TaxID=470096 RepID=A0A6A6WJP8_9PEZI|nr:uncharacterized protein EJ05DRAFT_534032 [Pseudovirgaria hyperparasitica]KAF2762486.1 hypothetical protein EJ05DRAFT_534032 [Pseudovirgaria hyperparasitica]
MSDGYYFPLFCTVLMTPEDINEVLKAAAREERRDKRLKNSWVLVLLENQPIFPMPTTIISRFYEDFIDWNIFELGDFCRRQFERTGLISSEDFAVIDKRSLEDQTVLFVRWEIYTPEDDAILRIVWGDATPEDEARLKRIVRTPEDEALLRKVQGKATMHDEALLQRAKEDALREDRPALETIQIAQDEAIRVDEDPRSDASRPDQVFLRAVAEEQAKETPDVQAGAEMNPKPKRVDPIDTTKAQAAPYLNGQPNTGTKRVATPGLPGHTISGVKRWSKGFEMAELSTLITGSPIERKDNDVEIMEGWRTMRVPIESAMRDTSLIFRRSITDLLKIRALFDSNGVLRY